MNDASLPCLGGVLSADIAVPEHEAELRFYSSILCTGDEPCWGEDLMSSMGMPVIGLGARIEEYAHLPLQWMPHIQVADVAASVERAAQLEGKELMHGKDADGNSQWAVLLDPGGAAFGLIPVAPPEAVPPAVGAASPEDANRAGRIAWLDLTVPDAGKAREFYRQVVGWGVEDVTMEDAGERYADYNMLDGDGNAVAGICHSRGVNQGVPPAWMIYLPVGDMEESLRRVEEGGGKIVKATRGVDGACATAVIQDPVGAYLALAPR